MPAVDRIPRLLCASFLLVAAAFKGYQFLGDPALGALYGSRWLQLLVVEYELLLASWLLSGAAAGACRKVALTTFAIFGCYAVYQRTMGAASCGCFGRANVSPWLTVGLDAAALLLLWRWRPTVTAMQLSHLLRVAVMPAAVGVILSSAVTLQPRTVLADGFEMGDSIAILQPEKWTGKSLPLLEFIDTGSYLSTGKWTVVFYRHDCPRCLQLLRSYQESDGARLALIEVPPFGARDGGGTPSGLNGRLDVSKTWFVETPAVVELSDGLVVAASSGTGSALIGNTRK